LACHLYKQQGHVWLNDFEAAKTTIEQALTETEADDQAVLRAAHNNLVGLYSDLGLSPKRADAFKRALTHKKRTASKDPRVTKSVVYSSKAYQPDADSYSPRHDPDNPRR
jgi:hypothetical protein